MQMSSIESAAFAFSTTPFTPVSFLDDDDNGLQATIAVSNATKSIYIAFRGTDGEEQDTWTDIDLCLTPFLLPPVDTSSSGSGSTGDIPDTATNSTLRGSSTKPGTLGPFGKVHSGFYSRLFDPKKKLYKNLADQVQAVVAKYPSTYNIITCGHSLGGSESLFLAAILALQVFPNRAIRSYSVGMPKTGNEAFKNKMESIDNLSIVRMVCNSDFAPHIPLPGLTHTGHLLLYLDEDYDNSHGVGRTDFSLDLYYRQGGSKNDGYAGVPLKDWLVTPIDFVWPLGNLYPIFSHIPWRYEEAADRAYRQGIWPTKFVPYEERSCGFLSYFGW